MAQMSFVVKCGVKCGANNAVKCCDHHAKDDLSAHRPATFLIGHATLPGACVSGRGLELFVTLQGVL